ncbi:helix-turn-helix domain-containing protein [Parasphingorhabdus sp. JC815]|uniref:AraC family transcriptional regulator n=1 Tax=Parasphingorhabdus sp. JC815 TaxID=3232140 RepID=UPI00345A002C
MGARKPVLLSALNKTETHLRCPQSKFPAQSVSTLCQATAQELDQDNIYLDIGRGITPSGFSDIGYAALFEDTVGGVLQSAVSAVNNGFSQPLLEWKQSPATCRLLVDPALKAPNDFISIIFCQLFHIGGLVAQGNKQHAALARFQFKQPRGCSVTRNNTRAASDNGEKPCLFGQSETSLEWQRSFLDLPNPLANRQVVQAADYQSRTYMLNDDEPASLSRLSYHYLFHLLDRSGLSIDAAAETFGMAERTLRRKLAMEGASFRQILEQVRRNTCQLYFLEGTRSLSEIATKLGYSELSAFTRAYTAWHGRSPSRGMALKVAVAA